MRGGGTRRAGPRALPGASNAPLAAFPAGAVRAVAAVNGGGGGGSGRARGGTGGGCRAWRGGGCPRPSLEPGCPGEREGERGPALGSSAGAAARCRVYEGFGYPELLWGKKEQKSPTRASSIVLAVGTDSMRLSWVLGLVSRAEEPLWPPLCGVLGRRCSPWQLVIYQEFRKCPDSPSLY